MNPRSSLRNVLVLLDEMTLKLSDGGSQSSRKLLYSLENHNHNGSGYNGQNLAVLSSIVISLFKI
jgi:hypothetical protein